MLPPKFCYLDVIGFAHPWRVGLIPSPFALPFNAAKITAPNRFLLLKPSILSLLSPTLHRSAWDAY